MAVHFKFRSAMEYDSIDIDGPFIAIGGLKEKIVEHKNLRSATDIDLLITNAQTGEEYTDDSFLVPKNTSVIIKRVPASGPKPILRVDEQPKTLAAEAPPSEHSKATDTASQPPAFSNPVMDGMDDFGIDLYALPEPMPNSSSRIDADENSRIAAMVNNTASEWQRQTQEAFAGGRGYGRGGYGRGSRGFGRATPPQGYVCHRCGQPGHFIQHCPTNGDPTYDMRRMKPPVGIPKTRLKADQEGSYILPDGSVAVMQPDETVFAKEADALLAIRPILIEPPPELRCPLCKNIFKDAVMIPCCQYSFCDKCIREELIAKGKCPQCGSTKFKNDDLLPNINLRQAIDRFLEAQVTTSGASDSFLRQQQAPDVESGPRKVPTPAASRLQIELRKPSSSGGVAAVQPPAPMEPVLADSVVESVKEPETGLKEKEEDQAQGSAVLTVAAANAAEDSGDAIEGPLSTKDEVVGAETVVGNVGGLGRDEEEKPGFVFDEGEAGKMMSKNMEPTSFKEADGVAVESEVSKGGPMPPMGMPPYGGGGDMYWHGPPVPQQVHPFPGGYGENMHGPGPGPFHFDGPMMPGPQYGLPPYMPPIGMPGGMMGPMDRPPLSREEFMELQERQRRRRIMQEHPEREWSQEAPYLREGHLRHQTPESERRPKETRKRLIEVEDYPGLSRKHAVERDSVSEYSEDTNYQKPKSGGKIERKPVSERLVIDKARLRREPSISEEDVTSFEGLRSQRLSRHSDREGKVLVTAKREREIHRHYQHEYNSEQEDDVRLSIDGFEKRENEVPHSRRGWKKVDDDYSRPDHVVVEESRSRSSKRTVRTENSPRHLVPPSQEPIDLRSKLLRNQKERRQDRSQYAAAYELDGEAERREQDTEKPRRKRHHSRSKSKGESEPVEYESDELKRKRKKHHRKHHEEESMERERDVRVDDERDLQEVKPRKHKSKSSSHPPANNIEVTRWQLVDSVLDDEPRSSSYAPHHSKSKIQHSHNGRSR
ncbi:unnamed protein product [Sphagnum jensenii]|uniref:Uncharacterized protein n=1 Tax=Sphagnum jensenii TaxID=128206 RepID=A0ABP1B062_9BRYO